ncbi:MAG: HAMP domain-containing histidine kinase [Bacteroidales bacterium]|nr:HAMP domain-containing histidine kinase [Bacteroidales bacterium]
MNEIHENLNTEYRIEKAEDKNEEINLLRQKLELSSKIAAEYNTLKSTFISNISHEIRTPLNAILGFSELSVLSDAGKEEMMEYMKIIHASSKELLEKVKDVIYISSLDAGMIHLENDTVSLRGLFDELNDHYRRFYALPENDQVQFKINPANYRHVYFKGDADKIKRILHILIDNGIKFTNHGFVELSFELLKGKLCFSIKDTGIGIPDQKQAIIFEPFTTAEDSYNRNYSGSGLGLTIVKHLLKLMNGEIILQSKVGEGTLVKIFLPYVRMNQI